MKVLFVCGGISDEFGIPPLIKAQGESLKGVNIEVDYFPFEGKGLMGYLLSIPKLKNYLQENHFDIIHAHYSFAGVVSSLTFMKIPIVVSLLGSDVFGESVVKKVILLFRKLFFWDALIVKSVAMNAFLKNEDGYIIPNGVNLSLFKPLNSIECKIKLSWDTSLKHILFVANPKRREKNYDLAKNSVVGLHNNGVKLHVLDNIPHSDIPIWLNAADIIILSSLWEGSPNVIKEAMASNRPIVSTNVGDVKWLFGNESGHYLTGHSLDDFSSNIIKALSYSENSGITKGRERIISLGLDSLSIAKRIRTVYESVLK